MIQNTFKNIYPNESAQLDFYNAYRCVSSFTGCYYMGYILEDLTYNLRLLFTTNLDWGKEYIEEHINDCHLWNAVQSFFDQDQHHSLILPWSTVPPANNKQRDIMSRKKEILIGEDGVSFCKKNNSFIEYYYFAPEINQKNFIKYINSNIDIIRKSINNLRSRSFQVINIEGNRR